MNDAPTSSPDLPIQATVQPRQILWNVLYAVLCGGLGAWGAWDYWVTIPQAEQRFEEFSVAQQAMERLAEASASRALSGAEQTEFLQAEELVKSFPEPPVKPASYDHAVQLWLYMIGCGLLGTPFFLWNLVALPRQARMIRLEADGSLNTPRGRVAPSEISGIDMSRWMAKSMVKVEFAGGASIQLDDYKFRGVDRIAGALCQRFHPGEWTLEAKPVKRESTEGGDAVPTGGDAGGSTSI